MEKKLPFSSAEEEEELGMGFFGGKGWAFVSRGVFFGWGWVV